MMLCLRVVVEGGKDSQAYELRKNLRIQVVVVELDHLEYVLYYYWAINAVLLHFSVVRVILQHVDQVLQLKALFLLEQEDLVVDRFSPCFRWLNDCSLRGRDDKGRIL